MCCIVYNTGFLSTSFGIQISLHVILTLGMCVQLAHRLYHRARVFTLRVSSHYFSSAKPYSVLEVSIKVYLYNLTPTICIKLYCNEYFFYTLQSGGKVVYAMDALFGLPRKKSSGKSLRDPLFSNLLFCDQSSVDEFVQMDSNKPKSTSDNVQLLVICMPQYYSPVMSTGMQRFSGWKHVKKCKEIQGIRRDSDIWVLLSA